MMVTPLIDHFEPGRKMLLGIYSNEVHCLQSIKTYGLTFSAKACLISIIPVAWI